MRVAVIKGGSSPEAEVSRRTAAAVSKALRELGHEVREVELDRKLYEELSSFKPDKVFIALHGIPGEDGTVQGFFETIGIPYTGCGVQASAICMDKDITKRVLKSHGINVPSGETYFRGEEVSWLEFPCVVKPARTGSTIGVSVVRSPEELEDAINLAFSFDSKVIVEEFIEGREITVPVLKGKALPPVEVIPEGGFYDYEAKYRKGTTRYEVPAKLHKKVEERLRRTSEKVFRLLECRGAIRVDFRLDSNGIPFLLEVNTIPGMTERSLLPKSAMAVGMGFKELIGEIIEDEEG